MRARTPSYVVTVKLHLPEAVKAYLEKSFRITNSAYNEALSFGLHRFEARYSFSTVRAKGLCLSTFSSQGFDLCGHSSQSLYTLPTA